MTNGDGKQKETLKVFGGAVMAGTERKKNDQEEGNEGRWRKGVALNHL